METLRYETRDGKGNDIIKDVAVKEYPIEDAFFVCPICKKERKKGVLAKKIISANFTDFQYIDRYICPECTKLFSLYFYNYIVDPDGIRLLNVRQVRDELCRPQNPPFRFIITTTQKKHLFYRSMINYNNKHFAVNLETETIYTTNERMRYLFDFVETLISLGASKAAMNNGEIPFAVLAKVGIKALLTLQQELKVSREILIPLYCGQKREKPEEELICDMTFLLTTKSALAPR